MRVFVYEHMSSGVLAGEPGLESLHIEGRAMLLAVLEDLNACPGIETITLLESRSTGLGSVVRATGTRDQEAEFRRLARDSAFTLVIAPETDDILATRCQWVEEENGRLLGPGSSAVRLTADKLALSSHLSARNIPVPESRLIERQAPCPFPFPVVAKPRDGAGSVATMLLRSEKEWRERSLPLGGESEHCEMIVQPFLPGQPASVALLIGPECVVPLVPALQHLSNDGRFRYEGGSAPLAGHEAERARSLAVRAASDIPGLRGLVGVDLVLGADESGANDAVIEINPRLTTSYVGLRKLARFNIAAAMLSIIAGATPPAFDWHAGVVSWRTDGSVTHRTR
jgi:predicted ATP-grasp superfamily ATP-dependent carboligase